MSSKNKFRSFGFSSNWRLKLFSISAGMDLAFSSSFYPCTGKKVNSHVRPFSSIFSTTRKLSTRKMFPCLASIANPATQVGLLCSVLLFLFSVHLLVFSSQSVIIGILGIWYWIRKQEAPTFKLYPWDTKRTLNYSWSTLFHWRVSGLFLIFFSLLIRPFVNLFNLDSLLDNIEATVEGEEDKREWG